ncbi:hypothetical protein QQ045_011206 [Rhodiola kirilowii]
MGSTNFMRSVSLLIFVIAGSLVNVRTEKINPITLNVIHSMGKDISLYLFCVSEKDKFAVADLQNAIMYEFDIEPNHEGTLLFWCRLRWSGHQKYLKAKNLVAYRNHNNKLVCTCHVTPSGYCFYNHSTNMYDICEPYSDGQESVVV